MRSKILIAATMTVLVSACTVETHPTQDKSNDNIIGNTLAAVSSMSSETGTDQTKVALYDNTSDLIHQFDLVTGERERSIKSMVPGGTHYVLFDPSGSFIVDFAAQHISIFNRASQVQDQPLNFVGTPKTASFRPSLGYLVVYDDLKSEVGLIKIDAQGNIAGKEMLGPLVGGNVTIAAGDITDQGKLVVSLSDNSIAVVDIDQSIAQHQWVITSRFTTTLTEIDWIAPTHEVANQVLVKAKGYVALVDTSTQAIVGTPVAIDNTKVIKTSKNYSPHFIIDNDASVNILYPSGAAVLSRTVYRTTNPNDVSKIYFTNILSSRLHLLNGEPSWTMVDTGVTKFYINWHWFDYVLYDDVNVTKSQRVMKRYRWSDMLPQFNLRIAEDAQITVTESNIFHLFPNKLGRAVNYNFVTKATRKIENFNYPFIH